MESGADTDWPRAGGPAPETGAETLAAAGSPSRVGEAARAFYGHAGPWILTGLALAALALRLAVDGFSLWDPVVALGVMAWWPVQEWLLHKGLLHAGPLRVAGRSYDPDFARRHRAHHREPWRLDLVILPLYVHLLAPAVLGLAFLVLPTPGLAATAAAVYFAMALHYEWMHFLVHTRVNPSSRRLRTLWRHHRLHHFKNEHYWFGFTSVAVDRLLGTEPDPRSVPTSPTCRTLGAGVLLALALGAAPASALTLRALPASAVLEPGDSLALELRLEGLADGGAPSLGGFSLDLTFDPAVLSPGQVLFGSGLGDAGQRSAAVERSPGRLELDAVSLLAPEALDALQSESLLLAQVGIEALAPGAGDLALAGVELADAFGLPLPDPALEGVALRVPEPGAGLLALLALVPLAARLRRDAGRRRAGAPETRCRRRRARLPRRGYARVPSSSLAALGAVSGGLALPGAAPACPPLLERLPAEVNQIEGGLGATNANAAVGDGGLTATLSRCGEITSLKWPSPSFYDQLQYVSQNAEDARLRPHLGALDAMGAFAGVAWETAAGSGFAWLRDPVWESPEVGEARQRYTRSTSGVVRTAFRHPGLRLQVVQDTFVLPGRDVLANHFEVVREPGSPVERARVLFYANFAPSKKRLPFFPVGDTGLDFRNDFALLYDSREEAFLHYLPAGVEDFTQLLDPAAPYAPDFSRLDPVLVSPPEDPAALRAAVQGLVDGLPAEDDGVYLALAAHAGDDGFQAGFDDSPQCAHQTEIAVRAAQGFGLPPGLAPVVQQVFACENTVGPTGEPLGSAGGPLAACRAARGWTHEAESAYRDAADGVLSGSPLAACHANAALARGLDFRGDRAQATFYVAAGPSRDAAYAELRHARRGAPRGHRVATERWWEDFLAPARLPDTDDPEVLRFARRALASLRTATDRRTTAMMASVAAQPPYGLDWPRDGAFLNFALDQAGYHHLVTEHNLLYAEWQRRTFEPWSIVFLGQFQCPNDPAQQSYPDCVPPGTWEMNYYAVPDAVVPGGPFSFEIDTAGLGVWTLAEHIQHVDAPAERSRYLHGTGDPATEGVCPAIRRGTDALAACRDPGGSGLQCPANEDDNIELTQGLQGAETVLLALESAAEAAPACGFEAEAVAAWETRAEELRGALVAAFREELPRPHLAGDRAAWALWPVRVLPYDDPLMASHAEYLREARVDPVLERTAPVLGYNSQNMIARAQRFRALGDAAALRAMESRVRFFIREGTTPGTYHMAEFAGRVDQDLDGDGVAPDYHPQNDVPHVWQQAYLYTAAMLVFGSRDEPAPRRCDATGDGGVDRADVDALLAAGGEAASDLLDPRDLDEDGRIGVADARGCALRCDRPDCALLEAGAVAGTSAAPRCGLLGVEAIALLGLAELLRRRRRRS